MISRQVLSGKHSDFTVTINDILVLRLHKVFLDSIPYFSSLFDDIPDSKEAKFHNIERPDILKDLLYTFYGEPLPASRDAIYRLYMLKYRTMLLLDPNDDLANLTINDYGLLLDVVTPLLGTHPELLAALQDNLPDNYDLSFLEPSVEEKIRLGANYELHIENIIHHCERGYNIRVTNALTAKCVYHTKSTVRRRVELSKNGVLLIVDNRYGDIITRLVNVRTYEETQFLGEDRCQILPNGMVVTLDYNYYRDPRYEFSILGSNLNVIFSDVKAKSVKVHDSYVAWLDNNKLKLYDSATGITRTLANNIDYNALSFTVCGLYIVLLKNDYTIVYDLNGNVQFSGYTFSSEKYAFDPVDRTLTKA